MPNIGIMQQGYFQNSLWDNQSNDWANNITMSASYGPGHTILHTKLVIRLISVNFNRLLCSFEGTESHSLPSCLKATKIKKALQLAVTPCTFTSLPEFKVLHDTGVVSTHEN